jgi:hypothetical protein
MTSGPWVVDRIVELMRLRAGAAPDELAGSISKMRGLRRNLWVAFARRTSRGPTNGADRVVRSIREPITNERPERPFDRGSDAKRPKEARGGREKNQRVLQRPTTHEPGRENPLGKSEGLRQFVRSLKPLSTGAAEHVVAAVRAKTTHRFRGRGKMRGRSMGYFSYRSIVTVVWLAFSTGTVFGQQTTGALAWSPVKAAAYLDQRSGCG